MSIALLWTFIKSLTVVIFKSFVFYRESQCTLMLLQICSYKRASSSRNSWKRLWQVQVSGNWLYCWTEWISIFRTLMENWWIHKSANKRSRLKKINNMELSELMRMIIIFVTFCLNKKKNPTRTQRQKIYKSIFTAK